MPSIMHEINERLRLEREQQQPASSHSTSPQPEQHTDSPNGWEFPNMTASHGAQRPRHRCERSHSMGFASVSSTLLDPRISNYKDGLLERALVSSISELDPASTNLLIYFTATHSPQSKDLQEPSGCSARCIIPSLRCRGQHGVSVSQKPDKKKVHAFQSIKGISDLIAISWPPIGKIRRIYMQY